MKMGKTENKQSTYENSRRGAVVQSSGSRDFKQRPNSTLTQSYKNPFMNSTVGPESIKKVVTLREASGSKIGSGTPKGRGRPITSLEDDDITVNISPGMPGYTRLSRLSP